MWSLYQFCCAQNSIIQWYFCSVRLFGRAKFQMNCHSEWPIEVGQENKKKFNLINCHNSCENFNCHLVVWSRDHIEFPCNMMSIFSTSKWYLLVHWSESIVAICFSFVSINLIFLWYLKCICCDAFAKCAVIQMNCLISIKHD